LNFNKLLRTYLGEDLLESLPPENLARINNDFETGIRKIFDGEDRRGDYTVAMTGIPDSCSEKIRAGLLRLSA
jgi:hypothetical protein